VTGLKGAFELAGAKVGLGLRPKNIGARVKRVEDRRLLTGEGAFTGDRVVPGALHVAFRRSDHVHALISNISTAAAAEMPGVFAIYTAQDLDDLVEPVRMTNYHATALYPLARGKVRYVGEPVVAVLAESRYLAEDALARIEITCEPLAPVAARLRDGCCSRAGTDWASSAMASDPREPAVGSTCDLEFELVPVQRLFCCAPLDRRGDDLWHPLRPVV
jgi:aerobic carbon-monoxide dehydrogenase large subunit